MKTVFVNDCAADGCSKKNLGKGEQMCKEHKEMYEKGKPFKAFYGKTVQKKRISETLKKHFLKEKNRKTISEKTKKAMWRKDVRENYLKGREKIDFQERSRKKKETEEQKRIVLLTKLSENYVDGIKLTELHKITGISYDFIRRNKLRWLSMREDTTSLKGK